MASPFDQEIDRLTTEIEDRRADCERLLSAFFDVTARELAPRLELWVKEESKRQHNALTSLAVERVTALKTELAEILRGLPQVVRRFWDRDGFWAHRPKWKQASGSSTFFGYDLTAGSRRGPSFIEAGGEKLDDVLNRELRDVFGTFLEKYGFRFPISGGYKFVMNGLDWTDPMNAAMKEYSDAYKRYTATEKARQEARTKKGRHEAEELWNKA